ncbi:ATP-dependent Clp protease proteolytic subunit [Candidatus Arsenophonus triatominarum]|uniref:ATP-dependent Clp protease proteolytic subunit n=1 Tax=Candidatus Arsenophonus triatominarum TaxID=57911 RepID=UPI001396C9C6
MCYYSRRNHGINSVIDEINNNYPKTKDIKLYINSFGGSMESAYMAYEQLNILLSLLLQLILQ